MSGTFDDGDSFKGIGNGSTYDALSTSGSTFASNAQGFVNLEAEALQKEIAARNQIPAPATVKRYGFDFC